MRIVAVIAVAALCVLSAADCQLVGGFATHKTDKHAVQTGERLIGDYAAQSGQVKSLVMSTNSELRFYASQVVAGTNYVFVYEANDDQSDKFLCLRFYESLDGTVELDRNQRAASLEQAKRLCLK
jgi:hypothetical protein